MTEQAADEAVELLYSRMQQTFGVYYDWEEARASGPIATAYLNAAARVVDSSGVVERIHEWDRANRKSGAGRKPDISYRGLLILFLLHIQAGYGVTYPDIANTLNDRMTLEHFEMLGIRNRAADRVDWYHRTWRCAERLIKLIDPFPMPRNKRLTAKKWAKVQAKLDSPKGQRKSGTRMERLDWLCEQLLHASVRMLPAEISSRIHGHIAIDATLVEISGHANPKDGAFKRSNADAASGRYRRDGSHDGKGAKTDKAGYELETAVLVWNQPGQRDLFPSLITAVSMHKPGELSGHGAKLVASHKRLGFNRRFLVLCDRAYNGGDVDTFHIPVRLMGAELVCDYRKTELGQRSAYAEADIILVDGSWYVKWMSQELIDATKHYRLRVEELTRNVDRRKLSKDERAALKAALKALKQNHQKQLESREEYRLKPHGLPDADGYQRFTYPKPTYMAFDPVTQKRIPPRQLPKLPSSVSIPIDAGESAQNDGDKQPPPAIKWLQKYPHGSVLHKRWYGMRSMVESSNKVLKGKRYENLGDPGKRSGRGFAFQYLIATLMAVSANIRKIAGYFENDAKRRIGGPLPRARRRKSVAGISLERARETLPLAPPL